MKSLIGVGKNIINVTSQFEQTQKALETVTQSAEKGKKLFEDLRKFSFDTTFGVDELANASSQLLNVGVSSSVLQKDLKMLGDLAQGDKVKFQELTSIFAKIQSTGKASSMQLQQLALRGIPINQTLKEMGVTGTASAEKLTEAFEKLTGVGGQFNNAMDNIIDTIEGKKGFITDTLKEINVNFGQLSGFTDLYKKVLDEVFDVLDSVNNKLMEWNQNPAHQAIIRGVVVAGITALTVAIGVGLVGAIKTLNKNLAITATLKALINPTAVALTVGISAITGLAVALETAKASANEYLDAVKEADKLKDKYGVGDVNMKKARTNVQKGKATTKEQLAVAVEDLQSSELRKKSYSMQVRNASYEDVRKNAQQDLEYEEKIYKNLQAQVNALQEQLEKEELLASKTQTREEYYQEMTDNFNSFTKKLGDAYTKYSDVAKKEKDLRELFEDRAKLISKYKDKYFGLDENGNAVKLELDPEAKSKYEKDLKAINDKYKKLEVEIAVSSQEDWQKKLQEAFGFTGQEVKNGATATTVGAFEYFEKMNTEMEELYKKFGFKDSKFGSAQQYAQNMRKAFDAVLESKREGTFTGDEASLKKFAKAVHDAENAIVKDLIKENKQYADILNSKKSIEQKTKEIFALEKNISVEAIEGYLAEEKRNSILKQESETLADIYEMWQEIEKGDISKIGSAMTVEGGYKLKNGIQGGAFEYAGGVAMNTAMSASSDGSNFIQGFAQGGIWGGIISTLIGALANVASSCENFDRAMNPITTVFKKLKPLLQVFIDIGAGLTTSIEQVLEILKPLISILGTLARICRSLGQVVNVIFTLLAKLTDFLFGWLYKLMDTMSSSLDNMLNAVDEFCGVEKEKTDEEKKQIEELQRARDAYQSLLDAMEENEEWYIRQKTQLNSNTRRDSYSVNDMILTPNGQFSTHPDDYIIATKNPQSLGGGAVVNVNIENNVSDVEVSATPVNRNGIQEIMIQISKKIADDVANGANGWDNALARQSSRQAGRQLSF